jgi:mono/diheme cytochrome c family protein
MAVIATATAAGTPAGGPLRSTADGVFSPEQVARGKLAYLANCSSCHLAALTGAERAPSLAGDAFLQRWHGLTVEELFQRIKLTMPQTKPQTLTDDTYIDIVVYLLDVNGLPSGSTDLAANPVILKAITISDVN